ncbi:hypothetical protein LTR53_013035 [Teratosphaeriaceae sp. CCFEE 6253]|nr:hypothetical protein LTR53_013035 [Teratosphaeriaceae sp. CCFEE 6253]
MSKPTPTTKSGIRNLSTGESIIPASTRSDGTVRKAIRVKPGYQPPEDVEVYKNRTAEGWKNRGSGGVPGAARASGGEEQEGKRVPPHAAAAAAVKNAKRREARRKAAGGGSIEDGDGELKGGEVVNGHSNGMGGKASGVVEAEVDPEAEAAREARKLAKKLRQARELKEKKEQGGALLPDQFAKVIKISELIRQLDGLGFDPEGERKEANIEHGGPAG